MIVVSQNGNHCVQLFSSTTGKFLFQFGGRGSADLQFFHPCGVAVDCEGNIVVCDRGNKSVKVIEVKAEEWSRRTHHLFSDEFKKATFTLLVAWSRRRHQSWNRGPNQQQQEEEEKSQNVFSVLPLEMLDLIISFVAASSTL